ncbi:MAG: hypothetical protein WC071_03470 [Victivallaceae bacterium]
MSSKDVLKTPAWYPALASHTFITSFVKLHDKEIKALAAGEENGKKVSDIIERMRLPMYSIPGNCFVSVDTCSPTDTERFYAKRGAVHSPESAWKFLAKSEKVRRAAANGEVEFICIRPFRRMNQTREFRLFIHKGELKAMSQYWLIRHFRRLEGIKKDLWKKACKFVDKVAWMLPSDTLVMDIYLTSDDNILIIDLNAWGEKTDPLLLRKWERDWNKEVGIILMPPPWKISGDVNVSF